MFKMMDEAMVSTGNTASRDIGKVVVREGGSILQRGIDNVGPVRGGNRHTGFNRKSHEILNAGITGLPENRLQFFLKLGAATDPLQQGMKSVRHHANL